MSQINSVPQGFLDLIDGKSGGINPQTWSRELRTTMELLDMYALNNMQHDSDSTTGGAVGSTLQITVPSDEVWFLYAMDALAVSTIAGQVIQLSSGVRKGATSVRTGISELVTIVTAGDRVIAPSVFTRPFMVSPGDILQTVIEALDLNAGADPTIQLSVRAAKFGPATKLAP